MSTFTSLGLSAAREAELAAQGVTAPTPVQAQALGPLLAGRDALIQSHTGTGKTLAYLLPLLEKIDRASQDVQALVLVPTQELGIQVRDVARKLTEKAPVGVIALIGGANPAHQLTALKKEPRVIVGTPGRILDFIRQGRLSGAKVRTMVIDEADQLLDKLKDVEAIFKACSPSRQNVFCSATFAPAAEAWARKWLKDPIEVRVTESKALPETIAHVAFVVDPRDKLAFIRRLVHHYKPEGAIAFVNENEDIPLLVDKLKFHQVKASGLFGGIKKLERAATMRAFRAGQLQMLIASELAARGLDLSQVSIVFNLDLPTDAEHYVHRVGRTGRMGRKGVAITLAAPQEAFVLEKFEKALGITFERPIFREGEMREAGEIDLKRATGKIKAAVRKSEVKAEEKEAQAAGERLKKPKKPKTKAPTKRQLEKGKAKKAAKKVATQKRQTRLNRPAGEPAAPPSTDASATT